MLVYVTMLNNFIVILYIPYNNVCFHRCILVQARIQYDRHIVVTGNEIVLMIV